LESTHNWDGRGTNLHHVWDAGLIEALNPDASSFATSLERRTLKHTYVDSNNPAEWAEESCRIVSEDGFYPSSRKLGMVYLLEWRLTLEDRLEIAGQRLVKVLNADFGD
jgi:hypothetical protein